MKNSGKLFITLALISSMTFGVTSCTKRGMEPTGGPGTTEQQGAQPTGGTATQSQPGQPSETTTKQTPGEKTGGAANVKGQKGKQAQGIKTDGTAGSTERKNKKVRGYW